METKTNNIFIKNELDELNQSKIDILKMVDECTNEPILRLVLKLLKEHHKIP